MSKPRKLSSLSRQELYDLVWSTPASKLAAEFGISDVALAKGCKRQNVPRPSRGYWAKRAAGGNPPKKPLPPPPDDVFVQTAKQAVGRTLTLPGPEEMLHPLATDLMQALPKARLDSYKRADLRVPTLPEANTSKELSERVARAFHVILKSVESLGIFYRKSQGTYNDGFFLRRNDRLYLKIEESMVDPDGSVRRRPSWDAYQYKSRPSGRLCFILKSDRYRADTAKEWAESDKLSLEQVLAQIVSWIREHYLEAHHRRIQKAIEQEKQRVEWERHHREWEAKEAIRAEQESRRKHAEALAATKQSRAEDLFKAAEWWRLNQTVVSFISKCEQRWQRTSGQLTPEQEAWLHWAREYINTLSPFEKGYPDAGNDGEFDPEKVPFGGPYPPTRNFPLPPTISKLPPLVGE